MRSVIVLLIAGVLLGTGNCSFDLNPEDNQDRYIFTWDLGINWPTRTDRNWDKEEAMEEILLKRLNNAEKSIHCAFSHFNYEPVSDVLIKAYKSGIDVKYVSDIDAAGEPGAVALDQAGVPTNYGDLLTAGNYESVMSHNYCIVDEQYVWLMTGGVTYAAFEDDYNAGFDIYSEVIAEDFENDFVQLFGDVFGDQWNAFESSPLKSSNTYSEFIADDIKAHIFFGPQEYPIFEVIKEVYRARSTIEFFTPSLTDNTLYDALVDKHEFAVPVEGQENLDDPDTYNPFSIKGVIGADSDTSFTTFGNDFTSDEIRSYSNAAHDIGASIMLIDTYLSRRTIILFSMGFDEGAHLTNAGAGIDKYVDFSDTYAIVLRSSGPESSTKFQNMFIRLKAMLDELYDDADQL